MGFWHTYALQYVEKEYIFTCTIYSWKESKGAQKGPYVGPPTYITAHLNILFLKAQAN